MANAFGPAHPPATERPVRTVRGWTLRVLIMAVVVAVPLAEVWALSVVGRQIGVIPTIAVVLATSLLGLLLVLREGSKAWRSLLTALREGRVPSRELIDASLIVMGGLAFMVPGLVTDLIGLVLLLPFSRTLVRRVIGAGLSRSVGRQRADAGVIRGATVPAEAGATDDDVVVGQLLP